MNWHDAEHSAESNPTPLAGARGADLPGAYIVGTWSGNAQFGDSGICIAVSDYPYRAALTGRTYRTKRSAIDAGRRLAQQLATYLIDGTGHRARLMEDHR